MQEKGHQELPDEYLKEGSTGAKMTLIDDDLEIHQDILPKLSI
jgi:hypothetical protein